MNIAFLVDSLHSLAAGSERQLYKLVEGLVARGHNVELVLLRQTTFTSGGFQFPCRTSCLNIKSILSLSTMKKMLAFKKWLQNNDVDVVHALFPDSSILAPIYLKSQRLSVFTSRRDMGLIYQEKPEVLYRMLKHRTTGVISNAHAVAELIRAKERLSDEKSHVVYNGIEPYVSGIGPETKRIFRSEHSIKLLLVANIKPVKRTLDAVKAVHALIAQGVTVELALVGERQNVTYVNEVDQYIVESDLKSVIHWVGQVAEPRMLMDQADIGLLVSESEGLSNTLMEYMQMGLPAIATRVGGNPELIEENVTGKLVQKGDVDALVRAISDLSENDEPKALMGREAQRRIQNDFTIDAMVSAHERLYYQAAKLYEGVSQ